MARAHGGQRWTPVTQTGQAPRTDPNDVPETFDERATLTTMLTYARDVAISKAARLTDAQGAQAPLSTSPLMTIGGVLHHLAWVERDWIDRRMLGGPDEGPWTEQEPDREHTLGSTTPLADVIADYRNQTARLDARVAEIDLDTRAAMPLGDGSRSRCAGSSFTC